MCPVVDASFRNGCFAQCQLSRDKFLTVYEMFGACVTTLENCFETKYAGLNMLYFLHMYAYSISAVFIDEFRFALFCPLGAS